MSNYTTAAKKRTAKLLAKDPDFFKNIRAKGNNLGGFYYLMENDPKKLKEVSSKGGKRSSSLKAIR